MNLCRAGELQERENRRRKNVHWKLVEKQIENFLLHWKARIGLDTKLVSWMVTLVVSWSVAWVEKFSRGGGSSKGRECTVGCRDEPEADDFP